MLMDGLDHPKTLDLSARLDASLPQVIGHLELLWAFTAKKTPRGDIGKWPDGTIARSAQWTGDATAFVTALHESGFIDASVEHRFVVHDWPDHCPRWVKAKLKKTDQTFALKTDGSDYRADYRADSMPSHAMPSQDEPSDEGSAPSDKSLNADSPDEAPDDPVVESIPLNDGSEHPVRQSEVYEFERLYPAVDVPQSLRNARGWSLANKRKRKTKRGVSTFITAWLQRDQDKGGSPNGGPNGSKNSGHNAPRPQSAAERFWARREGEVIGHG